VKVLDKNGREMTDDAAVNSKRGEGTIAGFQLLGISMRPAVRIHRPDAHPFTAFCEPTNDPSVLKCPDLELLPANPQSEED